MGAREDFMVVRRAAQRLSHATELSEIGTGVLLRRASATEADFIRLGKAKIQAEVIDLAYAVLGETRPEGPALTPEEEPVRPA